MLILENIETWGFEHAIRGMRNPYNSWEKSDSDFDFKAPDGTPCIGQNDRDLMQKLYKAGTEHRKYLRQIFVSMDITGPLYWWKEFDTYKIGTVSNSCSTMHKIHNKEFTLDDFSHEHIGQGMCTKVFNECFENIIDCLNEARQCFIDTKDKNWWWQMIQLLPTSYNQKRTITMNYENIVNIINQREWHKLNEWNFLVDELKELPYIKEIIG